MGPSVGLHEDACRRWTFSSSSPFHGLRVARLLHGEGSVSHVNKSQSGRCHSSMLPPSASRRRFVPRRELWFFCVGSHLHCDLSATSTTGEPPTLKDVENTRKCFETASSSEEKIARGRHLSIHSLVSSRACPWLTDRTWPGRDSEKWNDKHRSRQRGSLRLRERNCDPNVADGKC